MAKKKLYSLNALALECGKNFRTVSRALSDVKPDGKENGKPRWHLSSALAALDRHAALTGRPSSRPAPERFDPKVEREILEIEASGAVLDEFLVRLRGAATVEERRRLVEKEARVFGLHAKALAATIGTTHDAPLRRVYIDEMLGAVQAELLELCQWRLDEAASRP